VPAKDIFHDAVRNALIKDGWTITHDPLYIRSGGAEFHIDLGAERLLAAEKDGEKIAVEIKSFLGVSAISEFHTALGQYLDYLLALEEEHPERTLYLAIPIDTYATFFSLQFIQRAVQRYQLKLLVYDEEDEVIVSWKN
jgi:hypothetical protein